MKEFKFQVGQNFHCAEQIEIKTLRGSLCLVLSFLRSSGDTRLNYRIN
jgi:hypothetical protein